MKKRNLTPDEIYQLEQQGCAADDWMNIVVEDSFKPNHIWNSTFEGNISIGAFNSSADKQGITAVGIFHSRIIECEIGNNVKIDRVNRLKNYTINNDCVLQDLGSLAVDGETTFGNGTELEVLNEAGGRSLIIYDKISSQIAWLMVMCRHDSAMITQLNNLTNTYVDSKKSSERSYWGKYSYPTLQYYSKCKYR